MIKETEVLENVKEELAEFREFCRNSASVLDIQSSDVGLRYGFIDEAQHDKFQEFVTFLFDLSKPDTPELETPSEITQEA